MGGYSNYKDVHRELRRHGLTARHVIRPAYRESLRWLKYHIQHEDVRSLLPLLFVYDSDRTLLVRNEEQLREELAVMGLTA